MMCKLKESESCSVLSHSSQPHGLHSLWNSPGQNTGVGSLSLIQGIFLTQGSNLGLLHCRWILNQFSHKGMGFPGSSVGKPRLPPGEGGVGQGQGEGLGPSAGSTRRVGKPAVWPWYPWEKCLWWDARGPRRPCPPGNLGVRGRPLSLKASLLLVPQVGSRSPVMSLLMASPG